MEIYMHAYFLLELAYSSPVLLEKFSMEIICKSIVNMMLPTRLCIREPVIEKCTKLLFILKSASSKGTSSVIVHKYQLERYRSVASQPLPTLLQEE
jgi:hypothetical protein